MTYSKCNALIVPFFVVLAVVIAGCTIVSADAEGIAIRHSAENKLFIEREANAHCAAFGKRALEVQRTPVESKYVITTVVTTFRCVEPIN